MQIDHVEVHGSLLNCHWTDGHFISTNTLIFVNRKKSWPKISKVKTLNKSSIESPMEKKSNSLIFTILFPFINLLYAKKTLKGKIELKTIRNDSWIEINATIYWRQWSKLLNYQSLSLFFIKLRLEVNRN